MEVEILDIDVEKFDRMIQTHVRFLIFDVRDKASFDQDRLPNSFHIDTTNFIESLKKQVPDTSTPICLCDHDGTQAIEMARTAQGEGFINVVYLAGGMKEYQSFKKNQS